MWQVLSVGDYEAGHALLGHLQGEVVGVEVLAFEGEKDGILLDLSTVGGDFIGLMEMLVYRFDGVNGIGFNERSRLTDQTASMLS